jgi:Lon protease-like protein
MINFIPIFPLNIVVYPGELLNLHIFEDRYKQLINECFAEKKPFGIPVVMDEQVSETGTMMQVMNIAKTYDDGKMDITVLGLRVFRVLEIIKEVPDKLFSGAIVEYPHNNERAQKINMQAILLLVRELHTLMKVNKDFKKNDADLNSYDVAHHAGLSLAEEYEFLSLFREDQRLEYLKRHLKKIIPVLAGAEDLREKIKLNGHFKELKGFF